MARLGPRPSVLGVAVPLREFTGVYTERRGELACSRHVGLGLVALKPRYGIQCQVSFRGEFPLGKRLFDPQRFEPVSDVDHGLHCSHLLSVELSRPPRNCTIKWL